ncbi:MAG: LysM peptidoglycan-binding domain-containing protein [Desulfobacteraceae bacterium]|jgi:membrane-bound lytic murein transglycosylase D
MFFSRKIPSLTVILLGLLLAGCITTDKNSSLTVDQAVSEVEKDQNPEVAEQASVAETSEGDNVPVEKQEVPEKTADKPAPVVEKVAEEIPTDQELIDSALEHLQASNEFWEQGALENAIDCLDRAYSYTLRIDNNASPEIIQQLEDVRIAIAKKTLEVYSSRYTTANGFHKAIPLVMNSHVQKAINMFKGKEKKWFLKVYARSGKYRPAIVRELQKAGLPEELSWLPFIESGYNTGAYSSARALGMWQFIASTGYKYGLKRDTWRDERMDPEKSTKAAIAYLKELHQIFGEWTTALASYNCGEARVLRVIRNQKISYMDNFWDLYEKLPRETAFYLPKFMAVQYILNDPAKYGIELPPLEAELKYEKINISKQMLLKTLAKEIDVDHKLLKELNSELRQNVTPDDTYELKIPEGKGEILMAKLQDIPVYVPPVPAYVIHRVRNGESLSVIADKYNTSMRSIMNMNGLKSKNYLRAGWKLKIPTGKYTSPSTHAVSSGTPTRYVVRKGDSLWKIADRFGTTVKSIKAINGIQSNWLKIGQVLMISGSVTQVKAGDSRSYTVRRGDSPYLIAKRHSMNLYDFLKINNLTANSTIFPGQEVKVIPR